MIIEMDHRLVHLGIDCPLARYTSDDTHEESLPKLGEPIGVTRRAFVGILQRAGGNPQRALLGGMLSPGTDHLLEVVLHISKDLPLHAAASYPGAFSHALLPGLPAEFVARIPTALATRCAHSGVLTIDRAACDEVESSVYGFSLAADLLGLVLNYESLPAAESAIRQRLSEW